MNKQVWVLLFGVSAALGGCSQEADELDGASTAYVGSASAAGCYSLRDDKTYAAGDTRIGKHDTRRCTRGTRVCLAPDDDYMSECGEDGAWIVTHRGSFGGVDGM